ASDSADTSRRNPDESWRRARAILPVRAANPGSNRQTRGTFSAARAREVFMQRRDADALVLFGATGDLCYRKIYPALYQLVRRRVLNVPVIGVARAGWKQEQLAERVKKSITDFVKDRDEEVVQRFVSLLK